jgi:hypothetical protein
VSGVQAELTADEQAFRTAGRAAWITEAMKGVEATSWTPARRCSACRGQTVDSGRVVVRHALLCVRARVDHPRNSRKSRHLQDRGGR